EAEIHPDAWPPAIIHAPQETAVVLQKNPGDKYSYRDLDNFTDLLSRTILGVPEVSKVDRSGVLQEYVYLNYSQDRLASYGLEPSQLQNVLQSRNITSPGGVVETGSKRVILDPSGEFKSQDELGSVVVGFSDFGAPLYLRDLVDINRAYQS